MKNIFKHLVFIILTTLPSSVIAEKIVVTDCLIHSNTATSHGGGILVSDTAFFERNRIQNNYSGGSGGGCYIQSSGVKMMNLLVANNSARNEAGGVLTTQSDVQILSATIVNNSLAGPVGVGGVALCQGATLINALVAGNKTMQGQAQQIDPKGAVTYSAIQGNCPKGIGNINLSLTDGDLKPVVLFTQGITVIGYQATDATWMTANWSLTESSAGIDIGDNQSNQSEMDLARENRIYNKVIDMGAYEYGATSEIDDLKSPSLLHVHANPFTDHLVIENQTEKSLPLYLFDSMGRMVVKEILTTSINHLVTSHLPSGYYTAYIVINGERQTYKLLKR